MAASVMDVFIKSFGRPYYLDRCIKSIQEFLQGAYSIKLLDDGTASQYLEKIQNSYPGVSIAESDLSAGKRKAVALHLAGQKKYHLSDIPVAFWKNQIRNATEIFLLMEEDAWLTAPLSVPEILSAMRDKNLVITKIYWGGSADMVKGHKQRINHTVEQITPDLPLKSLRLLTPFLKNTLRIRSLLLKTSILPPGHLLPYYSLYTVSSAFFQKDYWTYLWDDARDTVRETDQILKAVLWMSGHPESGYAKTTSEKASTSYQTSSVNFLRGDSFDMIHLNHLLSEAWLKGELDIMQNFPQDYSVDYLIGLIAEKQETNLPEAWLKWMRSFKKQYSDMGIRTA